MEALDHVYRIAESPEYAAGWDRGTSSMRSWVRPKWLQLRGLAELLRGTTEGMVINDDFYENQLSTALKLMDDVLKELGATISED